MANLHFGKSQISRSAVEFLVNVFVAVSLSCLLSILVLKGLSLSPLNDIGSNGDFEMSDIYIKILDNKSLRKLSDVAIVGIDGLNRDNVGDLIEEIATYSSPKAIGLDILFHEFRERDTMFIPQMMRCDDLTNLVFANALDNKVGGEYQNIEFSYFQDFIPFNTGTINLDAETRYEVMRNLKIEYRACGQKVNTLPMEMIRLADDSLYSELKNLGEESLMIYYPANIIEVFTCDEILSDKVDLSVFTGKYVLMGDINLMSDCFMTPLGSMPGVMVHAYALNTLLEQRIVSKSPNFVIWIIAIFICFLFTSLDLLLRKSVHAAKFFLMRICQGFVIILLIVLGVCLLDSTGVYLNIALPLSMIAMGLLSNDIIFGLCDIYQIIMKLINNYIKS